MQDERLPERPRGLADARCHEFRCALDAVAHSKECLRTYLETRLDGVMILEAIRDDVGAVLDFGIEYLNDAGARELGRIARTTSTPWRASRLSTSTTASRSRSPRLSVPETGSSSSRQAVRAATRRADRGRLNKSSLVAEMASP